MNQIEESQWTESKLADEIAEIFSTFKEKSRSIAGDYYTNTILDAAVNKGILKIYLKHFSKETLFHLNKRTKKETQQVIRKAIRLRLHQRYVMRQTRIIFYKQHSMLLLGKSKRVKELNR